MAARFTSTDMDAAQTEVSEATRTATFTPGRDAARKEASKLNVPRIGCSCDYSLLYIFLICLI